MGTRHANPPEADRWAFFSSLLEGPGGAIEELPVPQLEVQEEPELVTVHLVTILVGGEELLDVGVVEVGPPPRPVIEEDLGHEAS